MGLQDMAMSGEKTGEVKEKDGRKTGNLGPHDIGGLEKEYRKIDRSERGFHLWEMQVCPLFIPIDLGFQ